MSRPRTSLTGASWTRGGAGARACGRLVVILGVFMAAVALAVDSRLSARLDAETATAVDQIVTEAAARGLPTEPLVAKALEGAMKRAAAPRIVAAVRAYAEALAAAATLLPPKSSSTEISAAAGALLAGVPGDTLKQVLRARQGQSITVPLVVLADLVSRSVPAGPAAASLLTATRDGISDAELLQLRDRVNGQILSGVAPLDALRLGLEAAGRRERAPRDPTPPPRPAPRTGEPGPDGSQHQRWKPGLILESGLRDDSHSTPTARVLTTARLDRELGTQGYWGALELTQLLANGNSKPAPGIELGIWKRKQRWIISASLGQAPLTLGGAGGLPGVTGARPDSTAMDGLPEVGGTRGGGGRSGSGRRVLATALQLGVAWEQGRTTLASSGGWRMASRVGPGLWGELRTNYLLMPHLALQLGWRGGTRWPGSSHERFGNGVTLGLRLSSRPATPYQSAAEVETYPLDPMVEDPGQPGAAAEARCVLTPLGADLYRLEFSGLTARRVDIAGDLTGWEPLELSPWGLRSWRATLSGPAGLYALNIRLDDGAWLPAPGLPVRDDGFSGRVGLLLLP